MDLCASCGGEVYSDGAHVLDDHDRASNSYRECNGPLIEGTRFEPTDTSAEVA